MNHSTTGQLLTEQDAAMLLGLAPHTLSVWRCTKRRLIPYVKVGRSVRYRRDDLDAWIKHQTVDASA